MTVIAPSDLTAPPASRVDRDRLISIGRAIGRYAVAYAAALVIFGAVVLVKGENPVSALVDMVRSTLDTQSMGDVLVRTAPYLLAGLAVAVPARAGLVNVGGEGQIVIGSVGAAAAAHWLDGHIAGGLVIVSMVIASALAGAIWAGIAAALRVAMRIPEAITTLLLNYVAIDVMLYLIYDPWKDKSGTGQPTSKPLTEGSKLPTFGFGEGTAHIGILIAAAAALIVWLLLRYTAWGFTLRVV
ncbi:MAG TPA: hypothetical protein VGQ20_16155, partial [Acidimicrobiales bacterium]|nr:hypothetical protein [Acidimicrobiales bacterium]